MGITSVEGERDETLSAGVAVLDNAIGVGGPADEFALRRGLEGSDHSREPGSEAEPVKETDLTILILCPALRESFPKVPDGPACSVIFCFFRGLGKISSISIDAILAGPDRLLRPLPLVTLDGALDEPCGNCL